MTEKWAGKSQNETKSIKKREIDLFESSSVRARELKQANVDGCECAKTRNKTKIYFIVFYVYIPSECTVALKLLGCVTDPAISQLRIEFAISFFRLLRLSYIQSICGRMQKQMFHYIEFEEICETMPTICRRIFKVSIWWFVDIAYLWPVIRSFCCNATTQSFAHADFLLSQINES